MSVMDDGQSLHSITFFDPDVPVLKKERKEKGVEFGCDNSLNGEEMYQVIL